MSWDSLIVRYLGHRVCIAVHQQMRYRGRLERVYDDSLVLRDVTSSREGEDSPWLSSMEFDPEDAPGGQHPEIVLRIDQVLSITCTDGRFSMTSLPDTLKPHAAEHLPETLRDPSQPLPGESDSDARDRIELEAALATEPILLEVGMRIASQVVEQPGFLDRVRQLRLRSAQQLGTVLPPVAVTAHEELEETTYRVRIHERIVAEGEIHPGAWLLLNPDDPERFPSRIETVEPVGGMPALWIAEEDRSLAHGGGGALFIEAEQVLMGHLSDVVARNAHLLLSGDDIEHLLTLCAEQGNWSLARELIPSLIPLPVVQQVFRGLLEERIPLRPLSHIVETLAHESAYATDAERLLESVRIACAHHIIDPHCPQTGRVSVWQLHPETEEAISGVLAQPSLWPRRVRTPSGNLVRAPRTVLTGLLDQLPDHPLVIAAPKRIRRPLWQAIQGQHPDLTVIAWEEIPADYEVECERLLRLSDLRTGDASSTTKMPAPHFPAARTGNPITRMDLADTGTDLDG